MLKFCPDCKSIISKKRISDQIVEFCNCPDKKEPKQQIVKMKVSPKRNVKISRKNTKSKKTRFTTIQESSFKPKKDPSHYKNLPLNLRFTSKTKIPKYWTQEAIKNSLVEKTNEIYERFYRNLENFFHSSELQVMVFFTPNPSLTDFLIGYWAIGTIKSDDEPLLWYYGTKLNDRGSWESTILEKLDDVFLPFNDFFPEDYKKPILNLDRLDLKGLCTTLLKEWKVFKELNPNLQFKKPSIPEFYSKFRNSKLNL